ncbi:hypothetical protein [Hymenobacter koreensis]|uniref:Uncharacterized protein n=1 Tax=Hymenobacter koreensis TaxID=1084523 RepID=A0ABP8IZ67_9BACT
MKPNTDSYSQAASSASLPPPGPFPTPPAASLEEMDAAQPAPRPAPRFLYWETVDPASNSLYPVD